MRKFGLAAAVVFVLAFAGAALAGQSPDGSHDGRPGHAVTALGKTVQLNLVDLGDTGFTLGDQIAFTDDLLDKANGKPAGVDGGVCTLVRVADATAQSGTAQCHVTYAFDGGQIATQGLLTLTNGGFTGTQTAAITGGTGRYANAHGESTLEFVRPGELKIRLALASRHP